MAMPRAANARPHWSGTRLRTLVVAATAAGLVVRAACIAVAPLNSYGPDHRAFMAWSAYAYEHGPLALYDCPPAQPVIARVRHPPTGEVRQRITWFPRTYNYPPATAMIYWLLGALWAQLDSEVVTLPVPDALRERVPVAVVSSRVIETPTARLVHALPSAAADFALAWGVARLAATLVGGAGAATAGAFAYAVTVLAPPVFLDSAFWNQNDSWVTCLMVWTVVALMRERLVLAGVLLGLGAMIKPQTILLGPVLVYALLSRRYQLQGAWRRALALWRTAVAALVTGLAIAAPFMLVDADHPDGAWRWFARSYSETLGGAGFARTTVNALNVWWLDYAASGWAPEALQARGSLFGITKDRFGFLATAATIALAWWAGARRWRWMTSSWPAVAYLVMLAVFTLSTRVVERYIYYCIPFLIALAVWHPRRWVPPLVAIAVVGTCEMVGFLWLPPSSALARVGSVLLAGMTVAALVYSLVAIWWPPVRESGVGYRVSQDVPRPPTPATRHPIS
jgi:hypothetical protein